MTKKPVSNPQALIVEDDKDTGRIISRALEAAGYSPALVYSGDVALTWLLANTPALAVLDLNLPLVPGEAILNHIRGDERLKHTIVIIATAFPHIADELEKQADYVLAKPISFTQLRDLATRLRC